MADFTLRVAASADDAHKVLGAPPTWVHDSDELHFRGAKLFPTTEAINTWLSFPSNLPPESTVTNVKLKMRLSQAGAETTTAVQALEHWDDLESQPDPDPNVIATANRTVPAGDVDDVVELDVTDVVQAVLNHEGYTNPGRICLRLAPGSDVVIRSVWSADKGLGVNGGMGAVLEGEIGTSGETAQSGFADDPETWDGGFVPSRKQHITVKDGHHLRVRQDWTKERNIIGAFIDIEVEEGGRLTVDPGATLSVKPDELGCPFELTIDGHFDIAGTLHVIPNPDPARPDLWPRNTSTGKIRLTSSSAAIEFGDDLAMTRTAGGGGARIEF